MEVILYAVAIVFLLLAAWAVIAGDREGQMTDDEESTMDVQNHRGD